MRTIWTTSIPSAIAALFVSLFLATTVFATEATNTDTGSDSSNSATVDLNNSATIEQINSLNVTNNLSVSANTGNNSASDNTGDGTVVSGDISGSVTVMTSGNVNNFDPNMFGGSFDYFASNHHTGSDSSNTASINVDNDFEFSSINNADINNWVGADLNTGGNDANDNTGNGGVISGDIDFDIEIVTDVNENGFGGPLDEDGAGPVQPPAVFPTQPTIGEVLGIGAGLPITGGTLPIWPVLLVLAGAGIKIFEKLFKVRLSRI